ncbi:hypothetical protein AAG906_026356 [Vitis piasezkii]
MFMTSNGLCNEGVVQAPKIYQALKDKGLLVFLWSLKENNMDFRRTLQGGRRAPHTLSSTTINHNFPPSPSTSIVRRAMNSKHKQKRQLLKRKLLDRRNATSDDSTTLRTSSLDLSPLSSHPSFQMQWIAAMSDKICPFPGLSLEDFLIWETWTCLSSLSLLPEKQLVAEEVTREFGTRVRLTDKIEVGNEEDVVIERNNVSGGNAGMGKSRVFPRGDRHMDSSAQCGIVNPSNGEEETEIERNKVDGENIGTEESCSCTLNDDDENSTLESVYGISPNGQFKRTINSWQRNHFFVKETSLLDQGAKANKAFINLNSEKNDETKLCIFLELAPEGSLLNLYRKHKLLEPQVSEYTRQILNGLSYLHGKHVIHRDVKCANILVFENHIVKLADFGLSKHCQSNDFNSSKGSPFWTAPEVVNAVYRKNDCYGLAADIWSLGCTVLEMFTQQHPYPQYEWMQALFRIGHGELPFVPDSLSIDARDFILKCLQVNPSDRPTARQLLDHPFVKSPLHPFIDPASPRANGIRP